MRNLSPIFFLEVELFILNQKLLNASMPLTNLTLQERKCSQ